MEDPRMVALSQLWIMDLDVGITGVAPEAKRELDIMEAELHNRTAIVRLTAAVSSGAADGRVGVLSPATVDVVELDAALAYATQVGCRTSEASLLLASAQLVRTIRAALLAGDWERLERVSVTRCDSHAKHGCPACVVCLLGVMRRRGAGAVRSTRGHAGRHRRRGGVRRAG
jgi:hypothetical protein